MRDTGFSLRIHHGGGKRLVWIFLLADDQYQVMDLLRLTVAALGRVLDFRFLGSLRRAHRAQQLDYSPQLGQVARRRADCVRRQPAGWVLEVGISFSLAASIAVFVCL